MHLAFAWLTDQTIQSKNNASWVVRQVIRRGGTPGLNAVIDWINSHPDHPLVDTVDNALTQGIRDLN